MSKKNFLILLIISLIFLFSGFNQNAQAGSEHNVSGWAWSENIGWISFNNTSDGGSVNYGVKVDSLTGIFSGYAWSRGTTADVGGVGWISFADFDGDGDVDAADKNITGSPCAPNCEARLDLTPGGTYCGAQYRVCGWARALAYGGGWDGWIKLRGIAQDGSPYGVLWNSSTQEMEGWAWSDMVVGWISFNCKDGGYNEATGEHYSVCGTSNYKVILNPRPSAVTLPVSDERVCGIVSGARMKFSWQFVDTPDDSQSAYRIQVANNSGFSSPEIDTGKINNPSPSFVNDGGPYLSWGTTYYWQLMVWDNSGGSSDWIYGASFGTPSHSYPYPDFTPSPTKPSANEMVTFYDKSTCYRADNSEYMCNTDLVNRYRWNFDWRSGENENSGIDCDSNINSICRGDATTTYPTKENYTVKLYITDTQLGKTCVKSLPLSVTFPLPKWREVIPK